ncbi:hypothetical protein C8J57DRAFT_1534517 [Mycena rebaudengoi]|nr:hypothetical protein C8J57DRAFT_1534517 [Mycena rebaudengoi]
MSLSLSPEERRQVSLFLGPWLIGASLDFVLQGVLFCQFVNYYTRYRDEKRSLQCIVAVHLIATVLRSIQSFGLIWSNFIQHFGDVKGAILLNYTAWYQSGTPLTVAMIYFYVQCYFCFRLYIISRNIWIVGPIALLFLFTFVAMVVATDFISRSALTEEIRMWFAIHLSSVFAGDLSLTLTTAYFLIRTKKAVLPQTAGLINALVRLTFQAAAPGALCEMLNLLFSQYKPGGPGKISTAFNMPLPKLYAISTMWTLNARRGIRMADRNARNLKTISNGSSGSHSRGPRRVTDGDVELGQIQVLTQTETHIVRDMFDRTQQKQDNHKGSGADLASY